MAVVGIMMSAAPAQAALPLSQIALPGGAQLILVQSPSIPMVDVQIDFDAGSRRDPAGKTGLASVTAGMTASGVLPRPAKAGQPAAPALDENALGEAWADSGGSFAATATSDRMSFSLRSLSYPDLLQRATDLAARQLGQPAFVAAVWTRDRQRQIAALKEANRRPATVAERTFSKAIYGGHPYGQSATEASLLAITPADMQQFYRQFVVSCNAKVSIVGAVDAGQAQSLATALLAGLPTGMTNGSCAKPPAVAEIAPLTTASTQRIPFESAQAHVLMGQPGFKRNDPDFFALTVGNYTLGGGGFVSRLTEAVREKRGLSYSVYSYFSPALHAGAFTVGLQTRPDQAAQAVAVAQEVVAQFVADGPTEAELRAAKDNLTGGFALRIDSNRKLLDNVASIAWNGLALDYLDTWTAAVEKLTTADVKAAFARKLQPQTMVTVIVGGAP